MSGARLNVGPFSALGERGLCKGLLVACTMCVVGINLEERSVRDSDTERDVSLCGANGQEANSDLNSLCRSADRACNYWIGSTTVKLQNHNYLETSLSMAGGEV
jgi:hypothetical protein